MKLERFEGIESKNRSASIEENLNRFEQMKLGTDYVSTINVGIKMLLESKNRYV
jgi:glutamyl-tRNA synthetase